MARLAGKTCGSQKPEFTLKVNFENCKFEAWDGRQGGWPAGADGRRGRMAGRGGWPAGRMAGGADGRPETSGCNRPPVNLFPLKSITS